MILVARPLPTRRARLLVAITAFAVSVVGAPVTALASPASTRAAVPAATQSQDIAERPDAVSAMVTARVEGHKVEDRSQRTPIQRVFAYPDGTWGSETAAAPVRTQDDEGEWHDIDTTLVKTDDGFAPESALGDVVLSDGGDATFASMTVDDHDLSWKWPTTLPAPDISGSTATYKNAIDGGDLVVTATAAGFSHDIVLNEPPTHPVDFTVPVVTGGPVLSEAQSGELNVTTRSGNELVTAPQPQMYDSSTDANGEPTNVAPVDTTVVANTAGQTLTLSPDQQFLTAPQTIYPVTIDPSYVVTQYATGDTWALNTYPNNNHPNDPTLQVGTNNGGSTKNRGFVQFANGPWAGQAILEANLKMRNYQSPRCDGAYVRVSKVAQPWSQGTLTWNNQPTNNGAGYVDDRSAFGASGCSAAGDMNWNPTAVVQSWSDGTSPNYGFRVAAADETNNGSFRLFRSLDDTNNDTKPRLSVRYDSYPNTPGQVVLSPNNNSYTSTATPTFSASVSDPDGGTVSARFNVYDTSMNLLWYADGNSVASGGTSTLTVPSGKLSNGVTYIVRAYGNDGSYFSGKNNTTGDGFTSFRFAVDTTAPSTTVSSSAYLNNQWLSTMPSSNTFTLTSDSDVQSFTIQQDQDSIQSLAASSGQANLSWNPGSGAHVLKVTANDIAGNRSATFSFSFGSGVGFMSPNVAQRSTGSFPVSIVGPPSASVASFSWRVAGTTTWNPASQITRASGSAWNGSVALQGAGSSSGDLVWKATQEVDPANGSSLKAPALLDVRSCFSFSSGANVCTDPRQVQLVVSGFDGSFPEAVLGPAQVALTTGEMTLTALDASDATAGLGRTFSSYADATVSTGVFGAGWSPTAALTSTANDSEKILDNRAKDGTFVVVAPDGGSETFSLVPSANGSATKTYAPVRATGDATVLVYRDATPATIELTRAVGATSSKTSWTLTPSDTGGAAAWVLNKIDAPGESKDVALVSEAQRLTWVRESEPGASSTCTQVRQDVGCRTLGIVYTGTGSDTRIAAVNRTIGSATQANVITTQIASYSYDSSGRLAAACGSRPAADQAPMCTTYLYNLIDGRTVVSQMAPPGQKPWRFYYTTNGRLQGLRRERPNGGDSVWSVDYDLSVTSPGLPDMSSSATAEWGEDVAPTRVYATYEPTVGAAGVTDADLYYTGDDGVMTNTATAGPSGWLVDTKWRNKLGDVVKSLDGPGWARVKAAAAPDRPAIAKLASSYTVFNTYGDSNSVGRLITDEYGPAHSAALKNGTTGSFRKHSSFLYDSDPSAPAELLAGRPALPVGPDGKATSGLGLLIRTTNSVSDASMATDFDPEVTKTFYKPVVSGDGDGWLLTTPVTVSTQSGVNSSDVNKWSTTVTRSDLEGRTTEVQGPGAAVDASGVGTDAHSVVSTYYTAAGTGDCGGNPRWAGLLCKSAPAGSLAANTDPTTWVKVYDDDLQPSIVQELVNGVVTRTTSTTRDLLGRAVTTSVQSSGPNVTNETLTTTTTYDPDSGLPTKLTRGSQSITSGLDSWGRVVAYTDALGTSSSTSFDAAGRVSQRGDGAATYAYTYGAAGLLTDVDAGGSIGSFHYAYTPTGDISSLTFPNGLKANYTYDEIGKRTGLNYFQGSTNVLSFSAASDGHERTVSTTSTASTQAYSDDMLGRLTAVRDTRSSSQAGASGCTTRMYAFDDASNRKSTTVYAPETNSGACQTASPTSVKSNNFDASGRLQNSGYSYDALGRAIRVPANDLGGGGDVTNTFHANDAISSMSQNVVNPTTGTTEPVVMTYGLDPNSRVSTINTSKNTLESERIRYRYSADNDSPTVVESSNDSGANWVPTRYVTLPGLGMVACAAAGKSSFQLANLHGDIVGSVANTAGTSSLSAYSETDEYGNKVDSAVAPARYGYLGSSQRANDTPGNFTTLMGLRLYNPVTGTFASRDSITNGSNTPYAYPENPVDTSDISGACTNPNTHGGGPATPIMDTHGFVGIPTAYCYDKNVSGKWHDFCSGFRDSFGGGLVSFKGPCAYHDMCLQYGWGFGRSDCDSFLGWETHRNCAYYFVTLKHDGSPTGKADKATCYGTAQAIFLGVAAATRSGSNYVRGTDLTCYLSGHGSTHECLPLSAFANATASGSGSASR